MPTSKILVLVVAYEAERHLVDVFSRVPRSLFNRDDVHFLCLDDASTDQGPDSLRHWAIDENMTNLTVVQHSDNQGYGGNQKLGYRIAIDGGFDFVVLLHGDGQYAPEELPRFIETWQETGADVVLGSRMHSVKSARQGGMPLYKIAGNRILSRFQNLITGLDLEEYHTGYRAFSTSFLQKVPFEVNSNDFHFDTEILLQAAYVKAQVAEIPIPTFYGDEVCRVPGLRYAWNVVVSTLQFKMHQMGMACSLKFRHLDNGRYRDKTFGDYTSHAIAAGIVEREKAGRVLDIGCGPGHVAQKCERLGCQVTGIDAQPPQPGMMTGFHPANLEMDPLPVNPFEFDLALMLDVIEHLSDPEGFLIALRNEHLDASCRNRTWRLVLSTPNVAFAGIRLNLCFGRFNYAERGILDITHKRLFTKKSLLRLLEDCGYDVLRMHPVGPPFEAVVRGRWGRCLGLISTLFAKMWPSLFAFQFLVECRPRPGVRTLLKETQFVHGRPLDHFQPADAERALTESAK